MMKSPCADTGEGHGGEVEDWRLCAQELCGRGWRFNRLPRYSAFVIRAGAVGFLCGANGTQIQNL